MSWKKRFRVLWAALTQTWAERKCDECGETWLEQGPSFVASVPRTCPICEADDFTLYMAAMDERSKTKGAA